MKKILLFILLIFVFTFKVSALTCVDGYEVIYNANKGKMNLKSECVSNQLTNIKPSRKGYAFLGWSKNIKASVPEYNNGSEIEINNKTTLYAVWSKGFKLSFNANGGKVSKKSKTVYKYLSYGSLPVPSKKGYSFVGWYTKKSGGVKVEESTIVNYSKKFTLYARWIKTNYKINYELNGGENNSKNKLTYNITTKTFNLYSPSKKGYVFSGWYTSNKYKTKVTKIKKGSTGNKTYYAKWTPIKYTIAFNGNGSTSGKMSNQSNLSYDREYTLKSNTFVKKDYAFVSWNTKKDGSGVSYNDKEIVTNLLSLNKKTITLYAQWRIANYNVVYELNGGSFKGEYLNKYNTNNSYVLDIPVRDGYTFDGWYLEDDFINKVSVIQAGSFENKTFYAKWIKIEEALEEYSISYELNGGNELNNPVTSYTSEDEVTLLIPERDGYTFDGWYTESNFENKVTKIEKGSTGNKTFYAKWIKIEEVEENEFKINYHLNGGVNNKDNVDTFTKDDEITLLNPNKNGYVFMGWYEDENFTTKITKIDIGTSNNVDVYAKWKFITKRNYSFIEYKNTDSTTVRNEKDIRNGIYNALNNGYDKYTLYCDYEDNLDCKNDFISIISNKILMSSISNYVNSYNKSSNISSTTVTSGSNVRIELTITKKYNDEQIEEIDKVIDKELNTLNLDEMSDSEKIKWAHDYLANKNSYDKEGAQTGKGDGFSAYGAIVKDKAVCQGYAEAMSLFLDRFNIPNILVSSNTHVWNLVYINGEWKHLDVTWDDPIVINGGSVVLYDYYLINNATLASLDENDNHVFNSEYYLETIEEE